MVAGEWWSLSGGHLVVVGYGYWGHMGGWVGWLVGQQSVGLVGQLVDGCLFACLLSEHES